jgi:hypothetical protein
MDRQTTPDRRVVVNRAIQPVAGLRERRGLPRGAGHCRATDPERPALGPCTPASDADPETHTDAARPHRNLHRATTNTGIGKLADDGDMDRATANQGGRACQWPRLPMGAWRLPPRGAGPVAGIAGRVRDHHLRGFRNGFSAGHGRRTGHSLIGAGGGGDTAGAGMALRSRASRRPAVPGRPGTRCPGRLERCPSALVGRRPGGPAGGSRLTPYLSGGSHGDLHRIQHQGCLIIDRTAMVLSSTATRAISARWM